MGARDAHSRCSPRVFLPRRNWKVDASLLDSRIDRVSGSLSLGLFLLFFLEKPSWVPLFFSGFIHTETLTGHNLLPTYDQDLMLPHQNEEDESAQCRTLISSTFDIKFSQISKTRTMTKTQIYKRGSDGCSVITSLPMCLFSFSVGLNIA